MTDERNSYSARCCTVLRHGIVSELGSTAALMVHVSPLQHAVAHRSDVVQLLHTDLTQVKVALVIP